jgi:hypothetical protein
MYEDILIRYYRESDLFYSENIYTKQHDYLPRHVNNILKKKGLYLSSDICHPYIEKNNILDYNSLKTNKKFLKDRTIIVAIHNDRIIGICIFKIFLKMVYLSIFCIERIIRGTGFSKYFLNKSININRRRKKSL